MTGPDREALRADKMIMDPRTGPVVTTSGDAMGRMREKYGSGVVGLPLGLRVLVSVGVLVPSAFWVLVSFRSEPPGNLLALLVAFLFATPAYVVIPALWERTEESRRSDWSGAQVQKALEVEMGNRELAPRVHLDPTRPIPRRW